MVRKIGFIGFANYSGLGNQSKRLYELLFPYRTLIINSNGFSKNKGLDTSWCKDAFITKDGFPMDEEIDSFLQGLTHVLYLENAYNHYLTYKARQLGIKTYCQVNYEFCENVGKRYLPEPDMFLMPSHWMASEMQEIFGRDRVIYLPPPLDREEFKAVREHNFMRLGKKRFLHIIGTLAYKDRNGTLDLIEAVKKSQSDFELVIRTQHQITMDYYLDDPRVTYVNDSVSDVSEMYKDFDALILPRKYGGLSLTTNEALMSGLPVIMTDVSPNNKWLPKSWLVESNHNNRIMIKAPLDVYRVDSEALKNKIDEFCSMDLLEEKKKAIELAYNEFCNLEDKYLSLFQ